MTPITLYNTLTQRKEVFTPKDPNRVTFYACGPTVYNHIHIGNARPAVVFDICYRLLKNTYSQVLYARNITDVDDKINKAAREENVGIDVIAKRFTQAYHEDMQALLNLPPTIEPRATQHIPQIIALIETLISKGHAYESEQHVLFSVRSHANYGKLSKRSLDEMLAGARVEPGTYKQDPGDFVLWKPSTPDLPGWDSPWGRGRPGWHIECSAMIKAHLGNTIDLHGGGQDLIFPHHENEIAQSECACGQSPFVRYWLHNGYITINEEKMSKSLGNFVTVHALLQRYSGETLRYALLSSHYRSPLNWGEDLLTQAQNSLDRLYQALRDTPEATTSGTDPISDTTHAMVESVVTHIRDDLNTPLALTRLHELAHALQKSRNPIYGKALKEAGAWLGLLQKTPEAHFQQTGIQSLSPQEIEARIEQRTTARQQKDFARSDAIRAELLEHDIELEDTPGGTRWRYKHKS